jgi:hypothetical protein
VEHQKYNQAKNHYKSLSNGHRLPLTYGQRLMHSLARGYPTEHNQNFNISNFMLVLSIKFASAYQPLLGFERFKEP